jgi:simple sugar transport system ATP-binding protein
VPNLLELDRISKSFGEVRALQDVDFHVGDNEIVGLLGDNGAGKSTLIKIVTGYHHPDAGEIRWKGEKVERLDVHKARELGIETVYQEKALADQQPLWRNIFMGRERSNALGLLDVSGMEQETSNLMTGFLRFTSAGVSPHAVVGTMSGGERQGVAIARALHFEAELIILDEPTMALSLSETKKVLDFVGEIRAAGKSAIFIDHNIFHVYPVADRIVVLDRGRVAGEFAKADVTVDELIDRLQRVASTGKLDDGAPPPEL